MGNMIEKPLMVDTNTLLASRGRFARVCMEVDLRRPLQSSYWLRGKWWKVQYKGLQIIYFHCRKYGHGEASCPSKHPEQSTSEKQSMPTSAVLAQDRGQESFNHPQASLPNQFGDWMIAGCRRWRPDQNQHYATGHQGLSEMNTNRNNYPTQLEKGKAVVDPVRGIAHTRPVGSHFDILRDIDAQIDLTSIEAEEDPTQTHEGESSGSAETREGIAQATTDPHRASVTFQPKINVSSPDLATNICPILGSSHGTSQSLKRRMETNRQLGE